MKRNRDRPPEGDHETPAQTGLENKHTIEVDLWRAAVGGGAAALVISVGIWLTGHTSGLEIFFCSNNL